MDILRFDNMLASSLGDLTGAVYTATMRTVAMSNAVRGYSRFTGVQRRYGWGALYADITNNATTMYFIGLGGVGMPGGLSLPLQVTLDYGTAWAETVTINSISRPAPEDNLDSTALIATIAARTGQAHYAGGLIWQNSPGLNLVAGTDTYILPMDFIEPDEETWQMAIGSRLWSKRQESYYDGVYRMSERIGGVGWGQRQGFSGGSGFGLAGVVGSATGLNVPQGGSDGAGYVFQQGNPAILYVSPAPMTSQTLDFMYSAQMIPQDVPDSAMDALLFLAKADCYDQRIGVLGQGIDAHELDAGQDLSKNIKSLTEMSAQARSKFDDYVRNLPQLISG